MAQRFIRADIFPRNAQEGVLINLKQDHQRVADRLEDLMAMPKAGRGPMFAEIKIDLRKHAEAKAAQVYPLFLANGVQNANLVTAANQLAALEAAIAAIQTAGATAATDAQYTTFVNAFNTHVAFEETTLFPQAYKKLNTNQLQMAKQFFEEAKRDSMVS